MEDLKISIPRGRIVGVQFGVIGSEIMEKLPRVKVSQNQNEILDQLTDKHMGVVLKEEGECETCRGTADTCPGEKPCPGHLGAVKLEIPIIHPLLGNQLAHILSLFCPTCHKLKFRMLRDMENLDESEQDKILERMRINSPMYKFIDRLKNMTVNQSCTNDNEKSEFRFDEKKNQLTLESQKNKIKDAR